jgi:hypothetical protein
VWFVGSALTIALLLSSFCIAPFDHPEGPTQRERKREREKRKREIKKEGEREREEERARERERGATNRQVKDERTNGRRRGINDQILFYIADIFAFYFFAFCRCLLCP